MFILIGILLFIYFGALIVQGYRKYILAIKEPTKEELWIQLEETKWYQELIKDDDRKDFIYDSKENGLLNDPYYIEKLIHHEGTREGFIKYIEKQLKKH